MSVDRKNLGDVHSKTAVYYRALHTYEYPEVDACPPWTPAINASCYLFRSNLYFMVGCGNILVMAICTFLVSRLFKKI